MAFWQKRGGEIAWQLAGIAVLVTLLTDVVLVAAQTKGQFLTDKQAADAPLVTLVPDFLLAPNPVKLAQPPGRLDIPPVPRAPELRDFGNDTVREVKDATTRDPEQHSENDERITYGGEIDWNSGYVWRGIALSHRPVMQSSAWISASGFTFTAWRNFLLADESETDLTLTYSRQWKKLTIEPTAEAYLNHPPAGVHDPNTMELALKLSYPAGRVRVFTNHAFDAITYRGSYFGEAGLAYEGRLTKRIEVEACFRAGWASSKFNEAYIGLNKRSFNFVGVDGSLSYFVRPHLHFQPHVEFSNVTDRQLRTYVSSPTFINVGLSLGVDF